MFFIKRGIKLIPTAHSKMSTLSEDAVQRVLSTRSFIDVLDTRMSYLDTKQNGDRAVVFLHGNPTAAYLWRGIIPHVRHQARCLAPDLVGMGHSDKLKDTSKYRFVNHYEYLSAWMDKMNLPEKVVLVIHDWGSGLGFHWANQHRARVQAIVHMESLVAPLPNWDFFPEGGRSVFQALRSPAGDEMVLKNNLFAARILPASILRKLQKEEYDEYLAPFKEAGESRRPTLTWPREIPIASDGPEDVVAIATAYSKWLAQSVDLPKLYINAEPGFFSPVLQKIVEKWPNQKSVTVKGHHFLQEDSPDEIGQAISSFLQDIFTTSSKL